MTGWTRESLAAKADWEGGVRDFIMDYGASPDYLPADAPAPVRAAWTRLYEAKADEDTINDWLREEA